MQVFSRVSGLARTDGAAYSLAAALEFGSRKSVKLHQNGRITEIAAHSGGFFSGTVALATRIWLRYIWRIHARYSNNLEVSRH